MSFTSSRGAMPTVGQSIGTVIIGIVVLLLFLLVGPSNPEPAKPVINGIVFGPPYTKSFEIVVDDIVSVTSKFLGGDDVVRNYLVIKHDQVNPDVKYDDLLILETEGHNTIKTGVFELREWVTEPRNYFFKIDVIKVADERYPAFRTLFLPADSHISKP